MWSNKMNAKFLTCVAAGTILLATGATAQTTSGLSLEQSLCGQDTISQVIYFDYNNPQSAETLAQLQNIQNIINVCDVRDVTVTGHTDASGSAGYNQRLSLQRANGVRAQLVDMGLSGDLVSTVGAGETNLLLPTADGVKEALNRRVEVILRINPVAPPPVVEEVYVEPEPAPAPVVEPEPVIEPAAVVEPAPIALPPAPVAASGGLGTPVLLAAAAAAIGGVILIADDTSNDTPSSP
jgi:hypothetical protein